MSYKDEVINGIIAVEGGFVDDPDDSGGATKYGITEAVARRYGYTGSMRDLPRMLAYQIYSDQYWHSVNADQLQAMFKPLCNEVVDTAVNVGVIRAGKFLQRALNVLNDNQSLYGDVAVDGHIGPATLKALRYYLDHREGETLVKALNCLQGSFYIELAERREKDQRFVYGWLNHRVKL